MSDPNTSSDEDELPSPTSQLRQFPPLDTINVDPQSSEHDQDSEQEREARQADLKRKRVADAASLAARKKKKSQGRKLEVDWTGANDSGSETGDSEGSNEEENGESVTTSRRYISKARLARKGPLAPPKTRKIKVPVSKVKKDKKGKGKVSEKDSEVKEEDDEADMENSALCDLWHHKLQEFGIRVMSPKLDSDNAAVAAYLGLESTGEMWRLWMEKGRRLKQMWDNFFQIKEKGYTMPDRNASLGIEKKAVFKYIQKMHAREDLQLLTTMDKVDLEDAAFAKVRNSDKHFAYFVWIAMIFKVVKAYPSIFTDTRGSNYTGPKHMGVAMEDISRAFFFIKSYCNVRHKEQNLLQYPGLKGATRLRWYTGTDMGGAKGSGYGTSVADATPAQGSASKLKLDVSIFGQAPSKALKHVSMGSQQEVKETLEHFYHTKASEEELDTAGEDDSADKTDILLNKLKDLGNGTLTRDKFTEEERKEFLWQAANNCEVSHDAFPNLAEVLEKQAEHDPVAAADTQAMNPDDGPAITQDSTDPEENAFWTLRQQLAAASENIPLWIDACLELGYTREQALEGVDAIRVEGSKYRPEVIQVCAAAWMKIMERGPLGGGILALDAGLGKTLTSLFLVVKQAEEIQKRFENNEEFIAQPTMVVCPAVIIHVWYKEIKEFFPGLLKPRLYYSNDREEGLSQDQKDIMLPSDPDEAKEHLETLYPKHDPQSARVVVLTSYETHTFRNCQQVERGEDRKNQKKEGVYNEEREERKTSDAKIGQRLAEELQDELEADLAEVGQKDRAVPGFVKGGTKAKDSAINDKTHRYMNPMRGMFARVLVDEGQKIKNSMSKAHRGIFNSFSDHYWIITATPMINTAANMHGYLALFWRPSFSVGHHSGYKKLPGPWIYNAAERANFRRQYPHYGINFETRPMETEDDLFALDPVQFARLANRQELTGEKGLDALSTILPMIQFKAIMATVIDVNGVKVRAGRNIKPYKSVVVELLGSDLEQDYMANILTTYFPELHKGGSQDSEGMNHGLRDGAVHRLLEVIATDIRLFKVIQNADALAHDVAKWKSEYNDRGASHYFNLVRPDPTFPPYATRWEMLMFLVGVSPKLRYLCGLIYKCRYTDVAEGEEPHKLLIFCNWPIELWELGFFLDLLGLDFVELRSGQSLQEKEEIITAFNDPKHAAKICITSFKNTALGVNLHKACHRICMMSMPENINTLLQCIGRVHRLGQPIVQLIWILGLERSYDIYVQKHVSDKFKGEVLGQAKVHKKKWTPPEIDDLREELKGRATLLTPYSEAKLSKEMQRLSDEYLDSQVNQLIRLLLGFRCMRTEFKVSREDPSPTDVATPKKTAPLARAPETPIPIHAASQAPAKPKSPAKPKRGEKADGEPVPPASRKTHSNDKNGSGPANPPASDAANASGSPFGSASTFGTPPAPASVTQPVPVLSSAQLTAQQSESAFARMLREVKPMEQAKQREEEQRQKEKELEEEKRQKKVQEQLTAAKNKAAATLNARQAKEQEQTTGIQQYLDPEVIGDGAPLDGMDVEAGSGEAGTLLDEYGNVMFENDGHAEDDKN